MESLNQIREPRPYRFQSFVDVLQQISQSRKNCFRFQVELSVDSRGRVDKHGLQPHPRGGNTGGGTLLPQLPGLTGSLNDYE